MDSEGHAPSRRSEHRDLASRLEILNGVLNSLTDVLDIRSAVVHRLGFTRGAQPLLRFLLERRVSQSHRPALRASYFFGRDSGGTSPAIR
jgi:hypothetical protein